MICIDNVVAEPFPTSVTKVFNNIVVCSCKRCCRLFGVSTLKLSAFQLLRECGRLNQGQDVLLQAAGWCMMGHFLFCAVLLWLTHWLWPHARRCIYFRRCFPTDSCLSVYPLLSPATSSASPGLRPSFQVLGPFIVAQRSL